jgi:hypothetical protein
MRRAGRRPGCGHDPAATPGLVADGHEYYLVAGAERLREVLPSFSGGNLLIAILAVPFKCPPAPHEGALLLHGYLVDRGVRDATRIDVIRAMARWSGSIAKDVDFEAGVYSLSTGSPRFADGLSSEHPKLGAGLRWSHSTITRSTDCGLTKKSRRSIARPWAQPGMTPGWSSRVRTADGLRPEYVHTAFPKARR